MALIANMPPDNLRGLVVRERETCRRLLLPLGEEMKRTCWSLTLLLLPVPALLAQAPAPQVKAPVPQQPVYIYLYSRVTDQINLDVTEDRLRHLLPMIERLRSAHPEDHVSATILFSGAVSQALEESNAKTHIKDFILDYKKRGLIEIGYDGTDEPTYDHRPSVNLIGVGDPETRWLARAAADEKFLTEARDPITGVPIPGAVGGLEEMQRVFGEAACIRGASVGELLPPHIQETEAIGTPSGTAGSAAPPSQSAARRPPPSGPPPVALPLIVPEVGDWEIAPILRHYNTSAVMFGLPEANPGQLPGFKTSVWGVGQIMSPLPETAPEVYWSDNLLHTSEWAGGVKPVVRTVHGYEGADALKKFAAGIDRSKIQVVHMELANEQDYYKADFIKTAATPSLAYAYAHPNSPKAPIEERLSADEVNAAYGKEEAVLKWLTGEYLPANPGSRFVSNSDLKRMVAPSTGYSLSVTALQAALTDMLAKWGNDTFPPNYLLADGHYLSLAETFQVLTDSLAEFDRTGKLPQTVRVSRIFGPITMVPWHGSNVGEVSVAAIAKKCSEIDARLHDETANPMPNNTVPAVVEINGDQANAAQFLRMMAQAMVNPTPEAKVRIKMTYMSSDASSVFPKARPTADIGATWTLKPAPLEVGLLGSQASR
jgi:hypothetical protein